MKSMYSGGVLLGVTVLALHTAAFARQAAPQAASTATADQQITVTGCVQREGDYRRAKDAGRGGGAGTGLGVGNEFVLTNALMSATGAASSSGVGASSLTDNTAYELSGAKEADAAEHVGRRVEIAGKLKPAEVGASGRATGGPTAGKPPEAIDVARGDLKLRELEVETVREVPGSCPTT